MDDPNGLLICHLHWKSWYNYNYDLNTFLKPYVGNTIEDHHSFSDLLNSVSDEIEPTTLISANNISDMFHSCKEIFPNILQNLGLSDIISLSCTCLFFNGIVNEYLKDDLVWKKFLLQKFFVDRNLAGKNYFESFRSIQEHCQKINKISFQPDYDSKYIVTKLRNEFDSKVNEGLPIF